MLRNSPEIIGYTIGASDGQLGKVTDFLFDDDTWLGPLARDRHRLLSLRP